MDVDYWALYGNYYFGHNDGAVSFPAHFPEAFAAIAGDVGARLVLDVGAGNNELLRRLQPFGLDGFSLDLRGDEARSVIAFDLTEYDPSRCDWVKAKLAEEAGGGHITTCLDVLEHLDRKHLATALWNLRELTAEWLLVSISTRPSSAYNLYHATVLPKRSWRLLLAAAGFEIAPHDRLADLAACRVYPEHDESCWSVNQWRRVDPFRDAAEPESYFLLLRRAPRAVDRDTFAATAARWLGLDSGRPKARLRPGTHLAFLVVHYQDFLQYQPYWEALPPDAFTVLMPEDAFYGVGPRREKAMDAWMRARGIHARKVKAVGGFDWKGLPGERNALISASESTASPSHLLSAAFVLEAQAAGVMTFQLQHGIWPQDSFPEVVRFFSEYVLTWGDEFSHGFHRDGSPPPHNRFLVRGCAKFDDYASAEPVALADVLGEWVEAYRHRVLVATNLHWPLHHRGGEVMPQLVETARSLPETLFMCKLHPVHDLVESSLPPLPPNLLVLDEFACLFGGIATSRLVRACDAVVCTLTSVALEAALADRPFVVLDTGNPNCFRGVEMTAIAALTEAVVKMIADGPLASDLAFRDHYFAGENFGKSLVRILEAIEETLATPPDGPAPPPPDALRAFASRYADYVMQIRPIRIAALEYELDLVRAQVGQLRAELDRHQAQPLRPSES